MQTKSGMADKYSLDTPEEREAVVKLDPVAGGAKAFVEVLRWVLQDIQNMVKASEITERNAELLTLQVMKMRGSIYDIYDFKGQVGCCCCCCPCLVTVL
jgi:hypothetical protein